MQPTARRGILGGGGTIVVRYVVLGVLLVVVWGFNLRHVVRGLVTRTRCELFMHLGLALFLSIPIVELSLGAAAPWPRLDNRAARIAGLILYLPSAALVVAAMVALQRGGRARELTESTRLVDTGIFALVRQPMTLGVALWSVALVLVFRSVFSLGAGAATAVLMWLAARSETELNERKFGEAYTKYARRVPMWNLFRSLRRKRSP